MQIGLDIMGGDHAPDATISGAILALDALDESDRIVLFGDETLIKDKLKEKQADANRFKIVHSPEIIGMSEQPIKAFTQKKKSSISYGFHYLKEGLIDSFSSAGNSGAMVVGSMYSIEMIPGIIRPCTTVVLPKENGGHTFLLDIGTNPDIKPDILKLLNTSSKIKTGSLSIKYLPLPNLSGLSNILHLSTFNPSSSISLV